MPVQGADGTPHFTYFDKESQLSFVWNGVSNRVEVSHGGYGEPVTETFNIPANLVQFQETPVHWLLWFQAACITHIALRGQP
jgi:hypothetical protein